MIIGHNYDGRIDVWSIGAVLAELYTGYVLFQNDSVPSMLARISGILGPMPHSVLLKGKETYKYYTSSYVVYEKTDEQSVTMIYPKKTSLEARLHFDKALMHQDEREFVAFLLELMNLDPTARVTAELALSHKWLESVDNLEIPPPVLEKTSRV